jgi:hypothetical protein
VFSTVQASFAAALLDAQRAVPAALTSHSARVPEKRFAVYRNNVVTGLIDSLACRFSASQRIVGEDFFRAMASVYVTAQPPRSPLLIQYGDSFPDFIDTFEPAKVVPYLADVARLEAARTRSYHAADAEPLGLLKLRSVREDAINALRFVSHPSAQIVRSTYPIVTIWAMNAGEKELAAISDWRGEDALVTRPSFEVLVRSLPSGGAAFLAALFRGEDLSAAAHAAIAEGGEFDLAANIAGIVESGAVADLVTSDLNIEVAAR